MANFSLKQQQNKEEFVMKKWFASICLFLLMGIVIITASAKSPDKIKIGHLVALTGPSAVFGQSEETGLQIAVEEINKKGGLLGRQIEIVALDTRSDPAEAVNAARRLISQEKVFAIIGVAQSGVANAVAPIITREKIPTIATAATNPTVTVDKDGTPKKFMFRVCFIDSFQGTVAAHFAFNKLNAKKASILYDVGSDYSQWLAKYFEDSFIQMGGKVAKEAYRTGELDFRAPLTKIKSEQPDVLFLPLITKDAALAAKQARELGIQCTFMGGDNWGTNDIVTIGGSAVNGAYFVTLASLSDPEIKSWINQNEKRFRGPIVHNALMAYDAAMLLSFAVNKTGSFDGTKVAEALEKATNVEVLTTDNFSIDSKTHDPLNRPAPVNQIVEGEFIFIEKYQVID